MKSTILLSVIVPVYNVEKYLERCLDSLTADLSSFQEAELILIDDGSADNSSGICDDYAKRYPFVRVIHQRNKGLAAVRNIGVETANGEFLSFIDSDDFIKAGLYDYAFRIIRKYEADILCFRCCHVYGGNIGNDVLSVQARDEQLKVFNAEEAIDVIFFDNYIDVITCNKIIKKSLFHGISYPEGKIYEDMFTTYKILSNAKKIVSSNLEYYVYCHRDGSIGLTGYNEKTMDLYRAAKEVYDFATTYCKKKNNLSVGFLYWQIVVANIMFRSDCSDENYVKLIQKNSRKLFIEILANRLLNKKRKIQLILFGVCLPAYKVLYASYVCHKAQIGKL